MKCVVQFCILVVMAVFAAGCATVHSSWRKASAQNSVAGYQDFLKKYPEGFYADSAREMLEWFPFAAASGLGTVVAYQRYLVEHPKGTYCADAKARIAAVLKREFDKAAALNSVVAYQSFIQEFNTAELVRVTNAGEFVRAAESLKKVIEDADANEGRNRSDIVLNGPGRRQVISGVVTDGSSMVIVGTMPQGITGTMPQGIAGWATLVFENGQRKSDRTFYSMGSFGATPRAPNLDELNDGDVVVFKGNSGVRGFTFEGKPTDPLKFVVLRGKGLVYLRGAGRVVRSDGSSLSFP